MNRLSKEEITTMKAALNEWQAPAAMLAISTSVDPVTMYNQAGLAFLRDGWVAGEFAKARNADQVRLINDEWPDFQLRFGDRVESFEAVEADDPTRRRGLEYTEDKMYIVEDNPIEDTAKRARAAPEWIKLACERKVAKKYPARAGLVIYLNMGEHDFFPEVKLSFRSATSVAHGVFPSVWILWKAKAYQVA